MAIIIVVRLFMEGLYVERLIASVIIFVPFA